MINLTISEIIKDKISGIKFGLLLAKQVQVIKNDSNFENDLSNLVTELKSKFANRMPSDDNIVGHVRRMYRRIGWEPTQYRPSSEALIRRILKDKGLYRINNLVDYGNLVSARYHLSMGLYDIDKINGDPVFDVGQQGESYQGISKDKIRAEGKLILRDDMGIFGNPTADSMRTSITKETHSALAIFFCPPEVSDSYLLEVLNSLNNYYQRSCPESEISQSILK
ncbi:MAG: phenylalanine--tRNA ligase beta subunit-related protein [Calditrichaceae bacterium]